MQFLNCLFVSPKNIEIFGLLWQVYNACTREFHRFKRSVPQAWLNKPKKEISQDDPKQETEPVLIADPNDRRIRNMKAVKYLLTQIPTSFIPLTCKLSELVGDGKTAAESTINDRKTSTIEFLVSSLENSFR